MTTENLKKLESAWELEDLSAFDSPSLESVIEKVTESRKFPDRHDGEDFHREKTSSDISVHIRSLPRMVWETIRFIGLTYPDKEIQLKAAVEGCLVHCGLNVLEHIFSQIPGTKKTFLNSYVSGSTEKLLDFVAQKYSTEYVGHGIKQTRRIYFLNRNDEARAMEISADYGMHLSQVVTLAVVAGMAQSESLLPEYAVESARKEIEHFRRWLIGTKYV